MNEETVILKFLNKNYCLKTNDVEIVVVDNNSNETFSKQKFLILFKKIIGDYELKSGGNSTQIFDQWFKINKVIFTDNIDKFIESLNIEIGSKKIVEQVFERFETTPFIRNYVNDWYFENYLNAKIKDLFSQFVITLGKTNWIVTWVGHGIIDDNKIIKHFEKDNDEQLDYVLKMYDDWYNNEVIDKSERMMKSAISSDTFKLLGATIDGKIDMDKLSQKLFG